MPYFVEKKAEKFRAGAKWVSDINKADIFESAGDGRVQVIRHRVWNGTSYNTTFTDDFVPKGRGEE